MSLVNPIYLDINIQSQIQERFEQTSEINLPQFLLPDKFQSICDKLRSLEDWKLEGPPNRLFQQAKLFQIYTFGVHWYLRPLSSLIREFQNNRIDCKSLQTYSYPPKFCYYQSLQTQLVFSKLPFCQLQINIGINIYFSCIKLQLKTHFRLFLDKGLPNKLYIFK